ncbi:MAG: divalent-cation tolerance protein CutA [Gallionellaceae bacterium]|jgi:periplasmic divalent cation tolerance protein|nr:divalent-cation tolerance protein CutA [Gallionellaceae bacterium]
MTTPLLVLTTLPDRPSAERLAAALVEARAAACVSILGACASTYRWQGKIETAEEIPLLIKTTQAAYARLEAIVRAQHPYELPEIVAVPVSGGLSAYIQWMAQETTLPDEE